MNLKKTLLSFMAAGAIVAGGFGGVAAQTTTGTVVVAGGGSFVPSFCNPFELTPQGSVTSTGGTTATGSVGICVIDDKPYRPEVNMSVSASDFVATDTTINAKIPAANLAITKTYNPGQARYSFNVCGPASGTSGQPGSNRPCVGDAAGLANSGTTRVTGAAVTWGTPGSLAGPSGQPVLHFWNGSGTSATDGQIGTLAIFDVSLEIPGGQRPATYQTTLTLNVSPTNP